MGSAGEAEGEQSLPRLANQESEVRMLTNSGEKAAAMQRIVGATSAANSM